MAAMATNESTTRIRPSRVAPSLNLYQPPAVRAAERRQTESASFAAGPTVSATANRPRDNSKDDRRNKRPDQQRYVPRPLRSESSNNSPLAKSESAFGDDTPRKVAAEGLSKASTKTRHSEIGTASSRMSLVKNAETKINSAQNPPEISGKVDETCTKRDKVSEKVSSRPILIRKRYSAPVVCVQSEITFDQNSFGLNVSEKLENNHKQPSRQNSIEGLNSNQNLENNHSLHRRENSVEESNSSQKIEIDHCLSKAGSGEVLNVSSENKENNSILFSQENSVEGLNLPTKYEEKHSSPVHMSPKSCGAECGLKQDESSTDCSIVSQVSLETGDSCSIFETDSNSMTEDGSNQERASSEVNSEKMVKSETISINSDVGGDKMEVDNSVLCEQVVPSINTDNQCQVCPEFKNTSCESSVSDELISSEVIKTDCLIMSSEKNPVNGSRFSKSLDEDRCSDNKSESAVLQDAAEQTAKRIKTEECDDWETLYDDDSTLVDPVIIDELGECVGKVKITAASSDYRSYQSVEERSNNGECIVEIYGFPAEFKTKDLMTAFAGYRNKAGFHIKWVDDTHALAVFNSPFVADEVLSCSLPFVKTRPLRLGVPESRAKARSLVLPPAVRPKTCPALAKRLVSGALGLRLQHDKKAREHERLLLKEARVQAVLLNPYNPVQSEANYCAVP
ncbi:uncharacterized protein LOC111061896 isoform X2 [Nilaparvata lugens]|uniref:uncharacterized protein LOC111061896 isoform X2 n=1 Tax=Nilaparvata lugens TaxID=108931 RepID=UPI00193DCEA0|nr:uncharacterized protein LOC111061896 isoform X2 [Nilaparvata lugens]